MQSALCIDPAPTMSMIGFVEKTVDRTLSQLLGAVLSRLLMELDRPHSRRRFSDRLRIYGTELDALRVFLSEAMPEKREVEVPTETLSHTETLALSHVSLGTSTSQETMQSQTHEHLSGIPPPCNHSTDDDGRVIEHE